MIFSLEGSVASMIHFIQLKFAESCRFKLGKEKIQEEIASVKERDEMLT